MSSWLSFSLLLLSILAAGSLSKGTLKLYFAAQFLVTLAEYFGQFGRHYTLVYICSTLLMVEMSVFLLWDAGVSKLTWRDAWTAGIWMTLAGGFGLTLLTLMGLYLLMEGLLFAAIGMAMLMLSAKSKALLAIGTLTWGMAAYDFLYLLRPEIRTMDSWLPSLMCSAAFLWLAGKQRGNYERTMQRNLEHQRR